MDIAALIISTISLLFSIASIVWLLTKHFSTHTIQREMVDPFKDTTGQTNDLLSVFKELGDPTSDIEIEEIERLKSRKNKAQL